MHGGGHTAQSWALVAGYLKSSCRVMSFDCRGHGKTQCKDETDFSKERLVNDAVNIITKFWESIPVHKVEDARVTDPVLAQKLHFAPSAASKSGRPDVLLVGHSMGGAIATHVAHSGRVAQLQGLMVLDVVEGTALEALQHMDSWIASVPQAFPSTEAAVEWAVEYRVVGNRESAVLSIPSQLVEDPKTGMWVWRTDLKRTRPYWEGWFKNLSALFLDSKCVKALLVAGVDRLDKPLTIAHMQGRYQLTLVAQSGHVLQEDQPSQVAGHVTDFIARYRLVG